MQISVWIMNALSRHVYDLVVASIACVFLLFVLLSIRKKLVETGDFSPNKIFYLLTTILLLILHSQILFVMNIELIHGIQFGILSVLLFPLMRSYGATIFWVTVIGAGDELFQYTILYADSNDYFDFNDVIFNMLGAAFAMCLFYIFDVQKIFKPARLKVPITVSAIFGLAIFVNFIILLKKKVIAFYLGEATENTMLILSRSQKAEGFWRSLENSDIVYHVMQPTESFILIVLLILFYFGLDFQKKTSK